MAVLNSFVAVLDLWGSDGVVADECGVGPGVVTQWRRRRSVPARYWLQLMASARTLALPLSYTDLVRVANLRGSVKKQPPPSAERAEGEPETVARP